MLRKIYVVDDDVSHSRLLAVNLGRPGQLQVEVFEKPAQLFARCQEEPPDAVITDLLMPGVDGIAVTRTLRASDPHLPIFVLTGHGDIASAVEALKNGATEYLTKPANLDELQTLLNRALDERPLKEEAATLERARHDEFSVGAILGAHPRIEEVRRFVTRVAGTPRATVLLLGESGTGKNLVARAIHYSGPQAQGRFVEINCAALPPQLLESELFGHQKGAFTDAKESKRGLIEIADDGTLFLDEIGDIPPDLQAKLLNFLESRRFRRVGGTEELEVSVRLITATNRNLEQLVKEGKFRADLFYRISVAVHTLPPLREIRDDIPLLANHFRELFNKEFGRSVTALSPAALHLLAAWDWPGNVRELRNVMERAMIFAEGAVLDAAQVPTLGTVAGTAPAGAAANGDAVSIPKNLSLADVEKAYIKATLESCADRVQQAAEILGISRKNLWEKRKRYGLLD
jgi:DNA-binding NtrC family response regulator